MLGFAFAAWAFAYLALWVREMLISETDPQQWNGLRAAGAMALLYGVAAIPAAVAIGSLAQSDFAKVCVTEGAYVRRLIGETGDRLYIAEIPVFPRGTTNEIGRQLLDGGITRVLSIPNSEVERVFTGISADFVILADCNAQVRPP